LDWDQSVARPLPTQMTTETQNKRTQISMIPVFERAKTVHALDRAATVIGEINLLHDTLKRLRFASGHYLS
jgi:hypothetical protein